MPSVIPLTKIKDDCNFFEELYNKGTNYLYYFSMQHRWKLKPHVFHFLRRDLRPKELGWQKRYFKLILKVYFPRNLVLKYKRLFSGGNV